MTKPTTIRLPEDLLEEIDRIVREANLDKSAYLREILNKGFLLDKMERMFTKYAAGDLSLMEICHALRMNSWQFLEELKARNLYLNVRLEDFLDSAELRAS